MISLSLKSCNDRTYRLDSVSAILFDLDGTLVDTLDLHIQSFEWILRENGVEVSRAELGRWMGRTPQDILGAFLPQKTSEEIWELAIIKEEHLYELTNEILVFDHVIPFLNKIRDLSLTMVVISSSHTSLVNRLLANADLVDYFDAMVSGDDIMHGKPHPEPFLKGLALSQGDASRTIGIGDSVYDLEALNRAGLKGLGITTGKASCDQLLHHSPYVISDFSNLIIHD